MGKVCLDIEWLYDLGSLEKVNVCKRVEEKYNK